MAAVGVLTAAGEAIMPAVAECEPQVATAVGAVLLIEVATRMADPAGTPLHAPVASPAVPAA
jgi:hypothetical protein